MANRFFNPNEQFVDSTGLPYAGGSLAFYASGTSTPLNTYSDSALTIANTNPVVLNSDGYPTTAVFLQNLAYKVVLSDVNSNVIWTADPVYASDYSTRAKLTSGAGSPNGSVAGTAGSTGIGADTYWDTVNNILYVCTQTGTTSTAVWTAINSSSAAAIVPPPQGYLTPTSGTPVITSDVISQGSLVYTPYVGNIVPIYTGTSFSPTVFTELTLTLSSSQAANTIYDVFVFNNSGALTLVTGPAWTSSTAGSCARGTGAGTTQLSRLSGIWVNTVAMTGRNASSTYSIPANQATYLGSIHIDTAAGQISCLVSYGQNRKWAIWNAYNRVPIKLTCGDGTTSWSYSTSTFRASNATPAAYSSSAFNYPVGTACNGGVVFMGLAEEEVDMRFVQHVHCNVNGTSIIPQNGIGINSITSPSGKTGFGGGSQSTTGTFDNDLVAEFYLAPTLGITNICCMEGNTVSGGTATWNGAITNMMLSMVWRG